MKSIIVVLLSLAQFTWAEAPAYKFTDAKSPVAVFMVKASGSGTVFYNYMSYSEWKEKQSGKFFPMDVAPVLNGQASGGVAMPAPKMIDPAKYQDQAAEFAKAVNFRNQGGRSILEAKAGMPPRKLSEEEVTTHVVQTVLSAVIDRPIGQLKLSTEKFATMAENTDVDHYHFRIPGSFVLEALEQDHSAARGLNLNQTYLLSVVDFRDYGCATLKNGIRDYFSKLPDKQKLMNESIYLISQLDFNTPADIAGVEKYFGKKPDAVLVQTLLYSDHLIRGAKTIFAFFAEGDKTRVVLLSNIAMGSKFFVGAKGALTRQYILDGLNGGVTGTVLAAKDTINDLLAGATADVNNKNSCNKGLARGLIKYSQSLFNEFANFMIKN